MGTAKDCARAYLTASRRPEHSRAKLDALCLIAGPFPETTMPALLHAVDPDGLL